MIRPKSPQTVTELLDRLSASTYNSFIAGWLDSPSDASDCARSVEALAVWDALDQIGIDNPDWVATARAAAHYARDGHEL